ncbi:hypothetical protein MKX01_018475 [Papaver californicum]|nr:hypothetical protein MKX01_018475 [Papaver californicum]
MNNWSQKQVVCSENEELVLFIKKKRQEMAETEGISERLDSTLYKAYPNVCNTKTRVKTLKELSQIKGVGKWILKISQEFFKTDSGTSEPDECLQKVHVLVKMRLWFGCNGTIGKKSKGNRRYLPQKNSVAYALLITLYRGTLDGIEFMRKQQLIDAAEASGLSRVPIMPEKGRGIPTQIGSSGREWYSGWSCMQTLLTRGLVIKSSCPAKYSLTHDSNTQEKSIAVPVEVVEKLNGMHANMIAIRMPPLKFGQRFKDVYNVILILDDREQFAKTNKRYFTTEIQEGFDVQRTTGLLDTLRKYGYLTQAITSYYREKVSDDTVKRSGTCPSFDEFIRKCEDLEKVTVSDVFGIQLMQVPQVTEEIALAVIDLYPTAISLARAYYFLEGNVQAQEEMLKRQSNNLISGPASRSIFQLIWGD